jgi:hypothetical protein
MKSHIFLIVLLKIAAQKYGKKTRRTKNLHSFSIGGCIHAPARKRKNGL